MNSKTFYDFIRPTLFAGKLNEQQVQNIEATLAEGARRVLSVEQVAYILATFYHETATTMQPIREYGKGANLDYGKVLKDAQGKTYRLDVGQGRGKRVKYYSPAHLYYGRGHVQVTWLTNYRALTAAAKAQGKNWDFVNAPDLLLKIEPSIWAAFHGMTTGMFTGRKLSEFFTGKRSDPYNARRVINGTDAAAKIQRHYEIFLKALQLANQ